MANENVIKGTNGLLSVWDTGAAAYLPLACLTEFGIDQTRNEITRQTFCNPGVIDKGAGAKDRSSTFSGLSVDTTSAGAPDLNIKASWDYLNDLYSAGTTAQWRLDAGLADQEYYFDGFISALNLVHPSADEDANFTGTISITGDLVTTDPNAPTT